MARYLTNGNIVDNGNDTVIALTCAVCKKEKTVTVRTEDFIKHKIGAASTVREAYPYLSIDDCELLISGVCGPCFDEITKAPDDPC